VAEYSGLSRRYRGSHPSAAGAIVTLEPGEI
jgi:hypothetical protein